MGKLTKPLAFLEAAVTAQVDECIVWPFGANDFGYGQVWQGGKVRYVHREVCERAHGPAPTPEHHAAHDNNGQPCASRACINPRHLRWATRAENMADKVAHDTHNRGERHGLAKITDAEAREILALRGQKLQREIAVMFGVSQQTVSGIHRGKNWECLRDQVGTHSPA